MAYVPNQVSVYFAAYEGAYAGMAASGKVPLATDPTFDAPYAMLAGAYAQSFDTAWGLVVPTSADLANIQGLSAEVWESRTPKPDAIGNAATTYNAIVAGVIALVLEAAIYNTSRGIIPPPVTVSSGRTLPALDASNVLAWDFQVLDTGLAPALGTINPFYASTGTLTGPTANLTRNFVNAGGGAAATLGPGGKGLELASTFFALGGASGGLGTPFDPATVPDNTSLTIEAYFYLSSQTTTAQGVIFSKAFAHAWAAPFNSIELNLAVGNAGIIEFGMTDTAAPGAEIGQTLAARNAIGVGYHHAAVVVDQVAKRCTCYVDGFARGNFVFVGGYAGGTGGPWMLGGNTVNTSDSASLVYSRATVSNVARSAAYLQSAAAGFLRS